ncbi:MAG TPA: glycerophosphodiester phosphodiesterase family protein [Acidimicrobiales bacterium]|nr:glycerophosphodiester phosphodiesterase family protein [Acidimicrobiales bacterium]
MHPGSFGGSDEDVGARCKAASAFVAISLTAEIVAELKTRVEVIFAWRVSSYAQARELEQWGVDGVIVDSLDLARELLDREG